MKKIEKTKKCDRCPSCNSLQPSPFALNKIYNIQSSKTSKKHKQKRSGEECEWYVNASEYGYCFWRLNEELDGSPMSDREICQLECISQAELKEVVKKGLEKIKQGYKNGNKDIVDFVETLIEKASKNQKDGTIYIHSNISDILNNHGLFDKDLDEEDEEEKPVVKKRGRKPLIQPIHRDGKKVDLYGLYSPQKLKEVKDAKNRSKQEKPTTK